MNIAITGSSGFIGRNVVNEIEKTFPKYNLILIDYTNGINILDAYKLEKIEKFDIMIHLAAKSYVPESFVKPYDFYYTNVVGTLNVLELCRKYKAKLIFLSSYLYGLPEYLPVDEKHNAVAFNPYGQSKLLCESLCAGYHRDFGIPTVIFRPFNVYGDGQNTDFLIPLIFEQIIEGKTEINLKDPNPKRDFVYINDVVNAIISVIEKKFNTYEVLNICSGESYSVREVTQIINSLLTKKVFFTFEEHEKRKNEVNDTLGSNTKINNFLNWSPKFSFEEGIKSIIKKHHL